MAKLVNQKSVLFSSPKWREVIGNMSTWTDSYNTETGVATLVGHVDWADSNEIMFNLLGLNKTNREVKRINRILPCRHWYYSNLYCTSVEIQGVQFTGKQDSPLSALGSTYITEAAKFTRVQVTATFSTLPYKAREDADVAVGQEYKRFVQITPKPKAEFITRTAGQMRWADTAAGGPTVDTAFPGEFNQLEAKTTYELKWWYVPEDYISDPDLELPIYTKIQAAIGTVNSATFMGVTAYKLLCLEPVIERMSVPNLTDDNTEYFLCNVTLPMVYFSPTNVSAGTTGFHGHLVKPFFNTTAATVTYYGVRSNGSTGGLAIYPTSDFNDIFKAWNG